MADAAAGLLTAVLLALLLVVVLASPSAAQEDQSGSTDAGEGAATEESDALLQDGAAVYSQNCAPCHQPGGAGIEGTFPPLIDNPNIAGESGADYLRNVIANGVQGELTVNGVTYSGVMQSFATIPDEDVEALVFYIQSGFQTPATPAVEVAPTGPVAGTELPALADLAWIAAYVIAALVVLVVVWPRLVGRTDRLNTSWFDAWLKSAAIFVAAVLAVAFIPSWVLQTSAVANLDRSIQDLIGLSVWGLGLLVILGGLWYAHKDSRV
ncbi:MAG: cytochrome c [Acidimicrobiia bacterium]|nr:cytochrome c [Acidimicrobiia bacterium]